MDLKMEVYTPGLELVGVLEVYRSVLWEEYAFKTGSFSLESLITSDTTALLVPENILWIEGRTAGIIESVQESAGEDGPYVTVKGPLLTGLLGRRILWGRYDLHGTAPALMYELVNDCAVSPTRGGGEMRCLPGLVLDGGPPTDGPTLRKQKTGGSLLEALEEIGEASQTAFGVGFNPQTPNMEFWARYGIDRSLRQNTINPVFYSTELDDVLSSEYSYDSSEWRNVALVAGEGEGAERTYLSVEGSAASGLCRRELWVDAKDLQSRQDGESAPLTAEEYAAVLQTRGGEKLAEHQLVRAFTATVRTHNPTYEYGTDFLLGDTITVTDERLGVTVDAVVQGVEWAVSREGERMSLVLGYTQPTLYERLQRKVAK